MAKLKNPNQNDPACTESSKPRYSDAVYEDPAVVEAWHRVADRIRALLPDLGDEPLTPRSDPRRWFGHVDIEDDPELAAAHAAFTTARKVAMQRYAHLRGAR